MLADINLIDFDALALDLPAMVHDLPAGVATYRKGEATGVLPDKLVRAHARRPGCVGAGRRGKKRRQRWSSAGMIEGSARSRKRATAAIATPIGDAAGEVKDRATRIGFLIHDVSRMRRTLYDQRVKPLDLTRSQWWVLAQLSREPPGGVLQTELANILEVGKVTIGGLIDRLEANGFVERRPDATDRRAKRVVMTPEGKAVLKSMVKISRRLGEAALDGMSPGDIELLETLLDRMKLNIKDLLAEGA